MSSTILEGVSPKIPLRSAIFGAFRLSPFCYYAVRSYRYRYRTISALGCYFHRITDIYPAVSISNHRYFTYCCDGFHACLADPDIRKSRVNHPNLFCPFTTILYSVSTRQMPSAALQFLHKHHFSSSQERVS